MKLIANSMMTVKLVLIFALVIHLSHLTKLEGSRKLSAQEDLEIEKQLKLLKKHTAKTIKMENGDTYDCVDFYRQPAFDNPLLKNHTYHFQIKPNFHNIKRTIKAEALTVKQHIGIGLKDKGCPIGTVPIRRNTKEDVIRAKLFEESYALESRLSSSRDDNEPIEIFKALAQLNSRPNEQFHGAGGFFSVYNPKVNVSAGEYSSAQVSLITGNDMIQAGWTVNPSLYNDTRTRLFIYFQGDSGSCFNTQCPGFIIVNTQVPLGVSFEPVSTRGTSNYVYYWFVQQDVSGNLWLQLGRDLDHIIEIGFWPAKLFNSEGLMKFAMFVDWGGSAHGTNTEMGSGYLPIGNTKYDAYCRSVSVMNESRNFVDAKVEAYRNSVSYNVVDFGLYADIGRVVGFGGPF